MGTYAPVLYGGRSPRGGLSQGGRGCGGWGEMQSTVSLPPTSGQQLTGLFSGSQLWQLE